MTEAIVDVFGFCAAHGRQLIDAGGRTATVRSMLHDALAGIIEFLADEARNAERLQELFFAADTACPACRLHEHHTTHAVRAATTAGTALDASLALCFPHYRQLAYTVDSTALRALARAQLEKVRTAVSIGSELAAHARTRNIAHDPAWGERLACMLGVVAGEHEVVVAERTGEGCAVQTPVRVGHLSDTPGCPVCAAIREAHASWLASVRMAARLAEDVWIVFPTCAAHIWECVRLGDAQLSLMVAEYGASVATRMLERGVVMVDENNEKRRIASESVWYRRQSPAYVLGRQRKMVTRAPRCPGCERSIVAREGAVASMVRGLRHAAPRNALAHGRELCLKHFAAVYLLLPADATRTALVGAQLERLVQVRERLARQSDAAASRDDVCEALRSLSSGA